MYIFMLSAVIVMSGCFGTGSTDGQGIPPDDGDEGTDGSGTNGSGTTVVNHYHNNTSNYYQNTTTIVEEPPLMLFSGTAANGTPNLHSAGSISINSNQTLEIVSSWATQSNVNSPIGIQASVNIVPDCFNTYQINVRSDNHQATELPLFMPTNGNSCNYEVKIGYAWGTDTLSWSILYRVHELG